VTPQGSGNGTVTQIDFSIRGRRQFSLDLYRDGTASFVVTNNDTFDHQADHTEFLLISRGRNDMKIQLGEGAGH
jgi:hypothetical protein